MNRDALASLRSWVERNRRHVLDPERLDDVVTDDDGVAVGRWGTVVGYEVVHHVRRRLIQFDRRGHLIATFHWRADGSLLRAKCVTANGEWIGVEPARAEHPAWGASDQVWLLDPSDAWAPREPLSVFEALDYAHLTFIPPLAEPRRLPAGAGTAVLNLVAGLMKDQGVPRVRYRGPYPTEQLFTALLESFRYEASEADPLDRFMDGASLDWLPAPHESQHAAPGLCVQLRHEIEKVTLRGVAFYRTDWQGVIRREPRVVRRDGDRVVCSLWVLGRSLEDRLVLDRGGEVLASPPAAEDVRPAAPLPPVWHPALADLIARASAPALDACIRDVLGGLALEWGAVPGDLLQVEEDRVRISRRWRDAATAWLLEAPRGDERGRRAIQVALEAARLLAPSVRLRAQMRLEAKSEAEQQRALLDEAPPAGFSESVGRLLAFLVSGSA